LRTGERRQQLLQVGAALFAEHPYEEVWVEQVAQRAGVSRGLLYHYFPTKRDFLLGIVVAEGERMQEVIEAHPDRPAAERLTLAVDAYLAYAAAHPDGFRAFQRTSETDAEVRAIKEDYLARTESAIVAGLAADAGIPPGALRIVARGWMAFVVEACLQWLDRPALSREQLRELCVRIILGAVGLGADMSPEPGPMAQNRGT
jgi:AcrR family transcriptional regulator